MKKVEKSIEKKIEQTAPADRLSFESISNQVDWERYEKPKKKKPIWKWVLIPTAAVCCVTLALGGIVIWNATRPYQAGDPSRTKEGEYSLKALSGNEDCPLTLSLGEKAKVTHEEASEAGSIPLTQEADGFSGSLSFLDGSLSEVSFVRAWDSSEAKNAAKGSFLYQSSSYSFSISFVSTKDFTGFYLTLSSETFSGNLHATYC